MRQYSLLIALLCCCSASLWSQEYNSNKTRTKKEISEEIKVVLDQVNSILEHYNIDISSLSQYAQIYKAANNHLERRGMAVLVDIGKGTFVKQVEAWANAASEKLIALKKDNTVLKLKEVKSLIKEGIGTKISDPLFNAYLNRELQNVTGNTRGEIATALISILRNSFTEAKLSSIFKKKEETDTKNNTIQKELKKDKTMEGVLPSVNLLKEILEYDSVLQTSKSDEKRQAEEKAVNDKWIVEYRTWLQNQKASLEDTDSTLRVSVIDKERLINNKSKYLNAPAYASKLWMQIGDLIEGQITGQKGLIYYPDATNIASKVLNKTMDEDVILSFAANAEKSSDTELPDGLKRWLEASTESNLGYETFEPEYQDWLKSVSKAVVDVINGSDYKNQAFQIELAKLHLELTDRFDFAITNQQQPGLDIADIIASKLDAKGKVSLENLDELWQDTVCVEIGKSNFINQLWNNHILGGSESIYDLKDAKASFLRALPDVDSLKVDILNSKWTPKPLPKPKSDSSLTTTVQIVHSNSRQEFSVTLPMPILFKPTKNDNEETWYHVLPNTKVIKAQSFDNHGSEGGGYKIHGIKKVIKGETTYNNESSLFQATTPVTYVLMVESSKGYDVTQEGEIGSMSLLKLDSSHITAIQNSSDFIKDNMKDKLGAELKIVGDEYGNIDKIVTTITFMTFKFDIGYGKDGFVAKCKSPLEYQKAILMQKIGGDNFDLPITVDVVSTRIGGSHTVKTHNAIQGIPAGNSVSRIKGQLTLKASYKEISVDIPE